MGMTLCARLTWMTTTSPLLCHPAEQSCRAVFMRAWCAVQNVCQHPQVKAQILEQLTAVGEAGRLRGFELVKAVHTGKQPQLQSGCPQDNVCALVLTPWHDSWLVYAKPHEA